MHMKFRTKSSSKKGKNAEIDTKVAFHHLFCMHLHRFQPLIMQVSVHFGTLRLSFLLCFFRIFLALVVSDDEADDDCTN